ncbi:MAG: transcription antitermination factor NusB [Candidatus Margulisbacteria bacterium]|nr:transcription antitermination factor NusB [Candidatus Margulisiibacteriota bacterium]
MGKRSTSRRVAMQAIYQADIGGFDIETAVKNIIESEKFIPETVEFAEYLARKAWEAKEESDQDITRLAIDWPLDRISKVDRSILRLAIKELRLKETPDSVIINEAIELAKKYSGEESSRFINGILGAFVRQKDK